MRIRVHLRVPITRSGLLRAFDGTRLDDEARVVRIEPDPRGADLSLVDLDLPNAMTVEDAERAASAALVSGLQAHYAATGLDLGWTARFEVIPEPSVAT